jgi:phenylalanyl-tRNA synthetase beta subunit/FtsZ-binding cell division protein ZapB
MEFSLSWLHDYVDLGGIFSLRRGRDGNLDGFVSPKEAFHLGEKLTAIGFAVEGYPIAKVGPELLEQEQQIDVDVTSNRPDAMCHLGLARELAVALGVPLRRPDIPLYESLSSDGTASNVVLEDPEGCPRYVARVIRGVKVGPSPEWLRRRLEAIGARSINNVVDATNYVLWEMGQPLHAFDLATIPGGEIHVRRARESERLTTLDGKARALEPEILVIADRERAIALAGIMGGLDTEVSERTTDVLLESAHFDRKRIRIGAKRLGLHTDASHRFERGSDFAVCDEASRRCAALIVEVAGGRVETPAVDATARRPAAIDWTLDAGSLERFAGAAVDDEEIERILTGLGFAPAREGAERRWRGTVPGWRAVDFEPRRAGTGAGRAYAQDLFEEVLRHVGYARIPATLPALGGVDDGRQPRARARRARARPVRRGWLRRGDPLRVSGPPARRRLSRRCPRRRAARARQPALGALHGAAPIPGAEPRSGRRAQRSSRRDGVRLFELGHLFPGASEPEVEAVAWVAGGAEATPWDLRGELDLLSVKGVGEAVLDLLGAVDWVLEPAEFAGVAPGTGAVWRLPGGDAGGLVRPLGSGGHAVPPLRRRAAARPPADGAAEAPRGAAAAVAGDRRRPHPDARARPLLGRAVVGARRARAAAARRLPLEGALPRRRRAGRRGGDHDHFRLPRWRAHPDAGRGQRRAGHARRRARAPLRRGAFGGAMSLEIFDTLETRIREAAERIEVLRERNAELETRVVELEAALAEVAAGPVSDWPEERAELTRRVERLVARLEGLLAG